MWIYRTQKLTNSQKEDLVEIWNAEYPAHIGHKHVSDFDNYLAGLGNPQHVIVCDDAGAVQGWLVTFDRDNERWFAMMLHRSLQGKGLGSALLDQAKSFERELNGWANDHNNDLRTDGEPYPSPIGFYLKNGFEVLTDVRLEKGQLSTVKIRWKAF